MLVIVDLLLIPNILGKVLYYIVITWWLWLPVLFFSFSFHVIQNYNSLKYRLSLEWVLLEIKVPKETHKSPKAMEQIFAGLHGAYGAPPRKWRDVFLKGKVPDWYSFEMIGTGGETHFYIRAFKKYKNFVESQVYAQYPEAEISETPDYVSDMPLHLPDEKYDIFGADLALNKEDAYPIRTYPDFEEKGGGLDQVKRIDPMASLVELFSTLRGDERIWIQILSAPTGDDWVKRGQAVLDKLMGRTPAASQSSLLSDIIFSIDKSLTNLAPGPSGEDSKVVKKEEREKKPEMTPGKQDVIKAMEKSWDKLGYQSNIRFLYIGPKDDFHQAHVAGIVGSFRQYSSQSLNGFKINGATVTGAKGLFKESKTFTKKRALYNAYRDRKLFGAGFTPYVLNTEELATIFHFPDIGVKSPLLPRVEAKKGEPPVGLPLS